jgi:hypothetical protein
MGLEAMKVVIGCENGPFGKQFEPKTGLWFP